MTDNDHQFNYNHRTRTKKEATQLNESINSVIVDKLKNGKWRYTILFNDGTAEVIRKAATKRYDFAFLYDFLVGVGDGAGRFFTFGKNPATHARYSVIKAWVISGELDS